MPLAKKKVAKPSLPVSDKQHYEKRLKIVSILMVVLALLHALHAIHLYLNARNITEDVLSGEFFKRPPHGHHRPPPHHQRHPNMPNTIDRDELAVHDMVKTFAFFGIVSSVLIICSGK